MQTDSWHVPFQRPGDRMYGLSLYVHRGRERERLTTTANTGYRLDDSKGVVVAIYSIYRLDASLQMQYRP